MMKAVSDAEESDAELLARAADKARRLVEQLRADAADWPESAEVIHPATRACERLAAALDAPPQPEPTGEL